MKNIFIISLMFISLNSFSQTLKYPSLNNGFGLKAGMNYSSLSGSINNDMTFKAGIVLGLYFQIRISNSSAVLPELIFSMQGCKNDYINYAGFELGKSKLYLNYLSFPLVFKTYIGKSFNVQYGPQVGILTTAKEKGIQNQYTYNSWNDTWTKTGEKEIDENLVKEFKPAELLIVGGIGYDFPFRMNISLRINKGITNIMDPVYFKDITGKNLSNVVFQFSVGYVFPVDTD